MTITEIFEELNTIYNQAWFDDAEKKFYEHPSNIKRENNFSITLTDPEEDDFTMVITFENFVFGARDNKFDDIYDEREMDKLEQVGYLPNGYPDMILPEGEHFKSSEEYYPVGSLQDWKNKIIAKIDKSLSLITNLADKDAYLDSLNETIQIYKTEFSEVQNIRKKILDNVINDLLNYIADNTAELKEIQIFINSKTVESKIHLNLTQASLAKLIYVLNRKEILDLSYSTETAIIDFFSNNFLVKERSIKNTNYVSLKNLWVAYEKAKKKFHKDAVWFDSIDLGL